MTEENPEVLHIRFAVHTAKFGYDWSAVPEGMTRDELDACYKRAIALKPEFLDVGDVLSGVLAFDEKIVAFVLQIAPAWDANGRDAEYGAFAFLSYAEAAKVDFDVLLSRPEFQKPVLSCPQVLFHEGPASVALGDESIQAAIAALRQGDELASCDFHRLGMLISVYGRLCSSWTFIRLKTADSEKVIARAEPRKAKIPTYEAMAMPREETLENSGRELVNILVWIVAGVMGVIALCAAFMN